MSERLTPFEKAQKAMSGRSTHERTRAAEEKATDRGQAPAAKDKPKRYQSGNVSVDFWGS